MIHILEKQVPTYFYCDFEFFDFSPGIARAPKLQVEKDSQKKFREVDVCMSVSINFVLGIN